MEDIIKGSALRSEGRDRLKRPHEVVKVESLILWVQALHSVVELESLRFAQTVLDNRLFRLICSSLLLLLAFLLLSRGSFLFLSSFQSLSSLLGLCCFLSLTLLSKLL